MGTVIKGCDTVSGSTTFLEVYVRGVAEMEIDYKDIDEPIRELVRVMNDVSFIETRGSCAGHPDRRWAEGLPCVYSSAVVSFDILDEGMWEHKFLSFVEKFFLLDGMRVFSGGVGNYYSMEIRKTYNLSGSLTFQLRYYWEIIISAVGSAEMGGSKICREFLDKGIEFLTGQFQELALRTKNERMIYEVEEKCDGS